MGYGDGTVGQSSGRVMEGDYNSERIYFPVVGIVMRIIYSDDPVNRAAASSREQRSYHSEAAILVVQDGSDTPWILNNVKILPTGASGVDNYSEEFPRPCTQMLDGSTFKGSFESIDYTKLDGDFCLISFIGGAINQPVMTHWFPHPGNRKDPATNGIVEGTLAQARRLFKRYQGTKLTIGNDGSIYIDTNEANSFLKGKEGGATREQRETGGDIEVSVKPGRHLQVNFNPVVPDSNIPSLPQVNPPVGESVRETDSTQVNFDKDFVNLVAGKVVELIGKQVTDSIILGANAQYHAMFGELVKASYDAFVDMVNNFKNNVYTPHVHIDGSGLMTSGATGTPLPNPAFIPAVPPLPPLSSANAYNKPLLATSAGASTDAQHLPSNRISSVVKLA